MERNAAFVPEKELRFARTEVTWWMSGGQSSDDEMSGRPTFETQVLNPYSGRTRPEEPARGPYSGQATVARAWEGEGPVRRARDGGWVSTSGLQIIVNKFIIYLTVVEK